MNVTRRVLTLILLTFAAMCVDARAQAPTESQPFRPGIADGASVAGRKRIVFLSGAPSHGFAQHEHFAGCMLLAKCLNENVPQVVCDVYKYQWPTDEHAFDNAAAVIMYCDGGSSHPVLKDDHLKRLGALMDKGVGLGCIHYAVEVPKENGGPEFLKWIGGYFEANWSINPDWDANFQKFPQHPTANGLIPFVTKDEWYFNMRFRNEMNGVTPLLTATPPQNVRGSDAAHNGTPELHTNPPVPQHLVWVAEREGGGRGFGCTGGHYHFNWASDPFRKSILNAIAWVAHVELPADGIPSKTPTPDELLVNLDSGGGKRRPANQTNEWIQQRTDNLNSQKTASK